MKSLRQVFLTSLAILAISSQKSFATDPCRGTIAGQVLDRETGEPLPFATIKILNATNGAIADAEGNFSISNICGKEADFEVRFLGYKTEVHHHDFRSNKHEDEGHFVYLAPNETELESVTVENQRLSELKSVAVQRKEVDKLSLLNNSIADLSGELTGVSILKTGTNISKPMIHGLHSNRVLVVNDGIRHAYQVWGEEHAPEIDPSHVDQIEIVKGAGTVKYGPEALGGVILYNSNRPKFNETLNGSIGTSFQTNGNAVASQLNIGEGFDRFAWNVGAYGTYQGDLSAPDYVLSNTGKREYGLSFNTLWHRPSYDLIVSGNYYSQELGILRGSIAGNLVDLQNAIDREVPNPTFPSTFDLQNPRQQTRHALLKADLSLFKGEHQFNITYAFQGNIRREFDIRRGEFNERPVIHLRLFSNTIDTEWIQPTRGIWSGNSGVQFFLQNSSNVPGTNTVNFVPNYNLLNVGAYTVQSVELQNTVVELGARLDFQSLQADDVIRTSFSFSNNVSYTNGTFTIGAKHPINDQVTVFANVGSAWRPTSVAELYSFGYHHSRVQFGLWRYDFQPEIITPEDTVYNQSLRSVPGEQSFKFVSGIQLQKGKITAEIVGYANRINNYIFLKPYGITTGIAGTFPFFIYEQTNALFLGTDLDIRMDHSQHISSELKVSYVHANELESRQPLLNIPPLNVVYDIQLQKGNWTYGVNLNYTHEQTNAPPVIDPILFQNGEVEINRDQIFDFMLPPDAFFLLGLEASYKRNHWTGSLQVQNALNESYRLYTDRLRYFSDAPGRNILLSFEYRL